jgi:hypothetical protein
MAIFCQGQLVKYYKMRLPQAKLGELADIYG